MLNIVASRAASGALLVTSALIGLVAAALIGLVAACAHAPSPPFERLAAAEATVQGAKERDAEGDERTALFVQLAEEEIAIAKNRMREGEDRRADLALQRAIADAELAKTLIREKVAVTAARRARERTNAEAAAR